MGGVAADRGLSLAAANEEALEELWIEAKTATGDLGPGDR